MTSIGMSPESGRENHYKPVDYMFEIGKELLSKEFSCVEEEISGMDLFGYNVYGPCCEIEIKVSDYDIYKEFRKPTKKEKFKAYMKAKKTGDGFCPTRFYYFVPEKYHALIQRLIIRHRRNYAGIILYNHFKKSHSIVKKSEIVTDKPFVGEFNISCAVDYKHRRITKRRDLWTSQHQRQG